MKWVKKIYCRLFGNRFSIYQFSTGYYSYDVEQAGYCDRCGFDTHYGVDKK